MNIILEGLGIYVLYMLYSTCNHYFRYYDFNFKITNTSKLMEVEYMKNINSVLHSKRMITENHIQKLEHQGKAGIRYTATISDIQFLIFGLMCDIGWLIHLISGIIYFYKFGFNSIIDWGQLMAIILLIFGVSYTIYMNKIHEKEIATKLQKNLSFGMTACAGLIGGIISTISMLTYHSVSVYTILIVIGGLLNFIMCLPIYLSFKKGIIYGIQ